MLFEELLERYYIKIPDRDRESQPAEACICGCNYYWLEDKITEKLKGVACL